MKKIFFILLGLFSFYFDSAQCACCGSSSNFSAGELTPTAYALGKRQIMGELYTDLRFFNGTSHSTHSDHQNQVTAPVLNNMAIEIIGLRYGISNKVSLLIQQPYILINSSATSSKAFGDLLSLINYKVYGRSNFVIGLQLGMEWPTGQYVLINGSNSISTGSGSYDPVAGFNMVRSFKRSALRASGFFKYTTKGFNGTNYGDFFGHQLGYNYFLKNPVVTCSSDSTKQISSGLSWSILCQLSGEWSQSQFSEHAMLANTGSYLALAGIGTSFGFKGFSIPIMLSVPFYQSYYGEQNQTQFRIRIGLTKTFN